MNDTKEKPLDLSSLDTNAAADKGFELELTHPVTQVPLGVFISLVGKDSTIFRAHVRRTTNERIRKQSFQQRRGKDAEVPTIEKIEADAVELLAACTTDWRGVTYKGAALPFSHPNAKTIYTDLTWIREQVDEAIGDLENFLTG